MKQFKIISRIILALAMIGIGLTHFISPEPFLRIVPDFFPYQSVLVYGSGFLEMIGGIGLLIPQLSQAAAWLLAILFAIVFPANLYQAINNIPVPGLPHDPPLIELRLPFQIFLIAWAWWLTKNDSSKNINERI